jgi:hypothetical protein
MKKGLVTILAFVYLSSSIGATIHLHYCMGKLISWGLINHESEKCAFCGMQKNGRIGHGMMAKKGCCKDEHKQIKTDKDQKPAKSEFQFSKLCYQASPENYTILSSSHLFPVTVEYPTANAPPGISKSPVFLLNGNFRI